MLSLTVDVPLGSGGTSIRVRVELSPGSPARPGDLDPGCGAEVERWNLEPSSETLDALARFGVTPGLAEAALRALGLGQDVEWWLYDHADELVADAV